MSIADASTPHKLLPSVGEVMLYRPLDSAGFFVGEAYDGQSTLLRDGVDVDDVVHADDAPREDDQVDVVPPERSKHFHHAASCIVSRHGGCPEDEPVDHQVAPHDNPCQSRPAATLLECHAHPQPTNR